MIEQRRIEVGKRLRTMAAVLAASLCMTMALTGCMSSETYTPQSKDAVVTTPVIGEDGVLRVGVDTKNPPLAGTNTSEKIVGVDVDIAAALADSMGLKLSIVDVGSDPEGALADGKVDLVMGIDNSDADGDFWLSDAYLPTGIALFSTSEAASVPVAGDGSTFAAQISSKSAWAVSNEFGDESLSSTTTLVDSFTMLAAGEVDYVASDAVVGSYAAGSEGIDVNVAAMLLAPSGYCVAVAQDNAELQQLVADLVDELTGNGVIDVIEMKWFGMSLDLDNVKQTAGVPLEPEEDAEGSGEDADDSAETDGTATDTASAVAANRP